VYEPPLDRGGPRLSPPRVAPGASLSTPFPFLAQEVFELVHQLLRVEGVVTVWARRLVPRCVLGLLQLPDIGLGRGVLRHGLVTARPKGFCRKFCSGGHEGAVAPVCGGD